MNYYPWQFLVSLRGKLPSCYQFQYLGLGVEQQLGSQQHGGSKQAKTAKKKHKNQDCSFIPCLFLSFLLALLKRLWKQPQAGEAFVKLVYQMSKIWNPIHFGMDSLLDTWALYNCSKCQNCEKKSVKRAKDIFVAKMNLNTRSSWFNWALQGDEVRLAITKQFAEAVDNIRKVVLAQCKAVWVRNTKQILRDWVLKRKQGDPYSIPEPIAYPCDQMWIPVCKHIFDFPPNPSNKRHRTVLNFLFLRLSAGVVFCCKGHHQNQIILSIVIISAIDFKKKMSTRLKFT